MERFMHHPTATMIRAPRWAVAMLIVAILSVLVGSAPANSASTKAHFGAHVNLRYGLDQFESIKRFESQIGRKLTIANKFHAFTNRNYRVEQKLIAGNRMPMISWRATDSKPDPYRARKIAAGQYDGVIRKTAQAVKALKGRVLIRFNWEMDQPKGSRQYIGTPTEFIKAWRRVVTIFRNQGATNAKFVWAPRANSFNKGVGQKYWPGGSYVHWIGGSAVPIKSFRGFKDIYSGWYRWSSQRGKPMLIWAGVRENPNNSSWKKSWISSAHSTLTNDWPKVRAFVYYHARSPKGYAYWADTTSGSKYAFTRMGCDAYFATRHTC